MLGFEFFEFLMSIKLSFIFPSFLIDFSIDLYKIYKLGRLRSRINTDVEAELINIPYLRKRRYIL